MILLTVGAQMPFDRLARAVDDWAHARGVTDILAQVNDGSYLPRHLQYVSSMTPEEFRDSARAASVIVGHAGMGTILTALEFGKPVVILPRRGSLRETRNDHQVATARRFQGRRGVHVAMTEDALAPILDRYQELEAPETISGTASHPLLESIRQFIHGHEPGRQ